MAVTSGVTEITDAVLSLKAGGVVLFPTDTLYGLGGDVFSVPASQRIFAIKGRPLHLALPVLVYHWDQVEQVAHNVPEAARRLAQRFWPGPLTLVLPKAPKVPDLVTGGKGTVAVRMPDHPIPLALAEMLGAPVTGTSANRSGEADPVSLAAAEAQLDGDVDYIIHSGPVPGGVSSTIVDLTTGSPLLLRQGALPFQNVLAECR